MAVLNKRKICLASWCNEIQCEKNVKEKSKEEAMLHYNEEEGGLTGSAKTLCIPYELGK